MASDDTARRTQVGPPRLASSLGLLSLCGCMVFVGTFILKRSFGSIAPMPLYPLGESDPVDAIVVLGGGLTSEGTISPWTVARCEAALDIYKIGVAAGAKPMLVTTSWGTTWKPPPHDARGFPISEASAAARHLISLGVPHSDIFEEGVSLDTVGNAFFVRTVHTDPAGWRRLVVITNEFHMPRTKAIFEWVFGLGSCNDYNENYQGGYGIRFVAVADAGLSGHVLEGRRAKEAASLESFLSGTRQRATSMKGLHAFLFGDHTAYASKRHEQATTGALDPAVLSTY
eukprot:CAMPEP_0172624312 /NCGR_PEP_ID=MMETSP1068-20121228/135419_1 /TAXON_ID=35684 /ORGANISM="Pseudopedinella elastica, Strain CCMP716" /LENGTH=285 /DNA_ID=CAMNT_0013433209 /DNA_START=78 /DNA_END=935 /DNA_ORIENTATION=+